MINCNPETVSTDYDTADRLYFEPLTLEDVLNVINEERPNGVIVQFGGQTPINLTRGLAEAGVPIWGTPPDSIDLAEDRVRFGNCCAIWISRILSGARRNRLRRRSVWRSASAIRCWYGLRMC